MTSHKRIYSNTIWMILEKLINVMGLFFVNSYMAKYVGPENYGKIAFASTLFIFIQTFSWFGLENVFFKKMSLNPQKGMRLALGTHYFRISILVFSSLIVISYLYFTEDPITFVFGIASAFASYYIVSDVFSTYNNSQLISKINTISNVIGLSIAFIIRFLFSYLDMHIYWFTIPIVLIPMIPYLIRKNYFYRSSSTLVSKKKYAYIKYSLNTGGLLLLSTLSIITYTQIANILLVQLVSYDALGVFSIIMTIGGGLKIITQAIITSYFSKIYETTSISQSYEYFYQINSIVVIISLFILLGYKLIGGAIVLNLYGPNYSPAINMIPIAIMASMFSSLGTISYRFMIKLNGYKYLSIKMLFVSIISIPITYVLIKKLNILGASLAFLCIEFVSFSLANYFFKRGLILKLHMKSATYIFQKLSFNN